MRKFFIINIIWLALILQVNSSIVKAQPVENHNLINKKIEENQKKLLSPNFEERNQALYFFSQIRKEDLDERILKAAIDLFKKELERYKIFDDFFVKGGTSENLPKDIAYFNSEAYAMYHVYLCELVGKSGDKNLLPLLTKHCLMMPKVFIHFGDDAIEPILDMMKPTVHFSTKTAAIRILAEMLKPKKEGYVASGEARNRIKKVLIQATSDNDRHVRSVSVRALGDSEDEDALPILEKIAQSDPFSVEKKDPFTGKTITDPATGKTITLYPMREEAQKAIQKIKEKKKPEGK